VSDAVADRVGVLHDVGQFVGGALERQTLAEGERRDSVVAPQL
jgi:hypothetical protein